MQPLCCDLHVCAPRAAGARGRPQRTAHIPRNRYGVSYELHAESLASPLRGTDWTGVAMIYKCLYIDAADPTFLQLDARYRAEFLDPETIWRYARDPQNDLNEESV